MKNYTKPSDEELRKKLTPIQYEVTQRDATEPPHQNEYWNHKEEQFLVLILKALQLNNHPKSTAKIMLGKENLNKLAVGILIYLEIFKSYFRG